MISFIDPARFAGKSFTRHELATNDYSMMIDGIVAGRLMRKSLSGQREVWFWKLTGPYLPPEMQPTHGECQTMDEALDAFKIKFRAWQRWATPAGKAVWHLVTEKLATDFRPE